MATVDLTGAPATAVLHVDGGGFKNDGSGSWAFASDARLKDDVRDLELGLAELRQVRPVRFRYNGRARYARPGRPASACSGRKSRRSFPRPSSGSALPDDPGLDDLRVFDPSALTFVLINAVKELAARVEQLEQALAAATAADRSRASHRVRPASTP